MSENHEKQALSANAAYQLAEFEKTPPQFQAITPRYLTRMLDWKPLNSGVFRLNRVKQGETLLDILQSHAGTQDIPEGFIDYDPHPKEIALTCVSSIIRIETRVSDIYSHPNDQIKEQLRLAMESIKEKQEHLIVNSDDYGLLKHTVPSQRIKPRKGYPTPDDLDELIVRVWKDPSFFLAHPAAIAAFGRECTRRGVPPSTLTLFGTPFIAWRGIPIIPSDKLLLNGAPNSPSCGKTDILLIRSGEKKQGVIGLYQAGVPGEQSKGLSVRFMGIDNHGVGLYLLSLYCSVAVLTDDAIAVLEDVDTTHYYDYQ